MNLLQSYVFTVIATVAGYVGYITMSYYLYRSQLDTLWYCSADNHVLNALRMSFEQDMIRVVISALAVAFVLLIIGVVVLVTSDNR